MAKQGSARKPLRERVNGSNAAAASEAATPEEAAYSEHEAPADAETEAAQVLWPSVPSYISLCMHMEASLVSDNVPNSIERPLTGDLLTGISYGGVYSMWFFLNNRRW